MSGNIPYSVVLKQADTFFGDFWGQPEGSHVFWEGTVWHHLVAKFLDEIPANSRGQAAFFQVVEKSSVRLKMIKLLNLLSVLSLKKEELKAEICSFVRTGEHPKTSIGIIFVHRHKLWRKNLIFQTNRTENFENTIQKSVGWKGFFLLTVFMSLCAILGVKSWFPQLLRCCCFWR